MKYLKLFKDLASYEAWKNSEDFVLPNVVFNEETGSIFYATNVAPSSPNVVCVYDVTDISRNTTILYGYALRDVTRMIVDGIEMDAETYYQFDTTGLHTVEFVLDDKTTISNLWFRNVDNLVSIEIPDTVLSFGNNYSVIGSGNNNLKEITFHSSIPPTGMFCEYPEDLLQRGVVKYPKGSNYLSSVLFDQFPDRYWTWVEF